MGWWHLFAPCLCLVPVSRPWHRLLQFLHTVIPFYLRLLQPLQVFTVIQETVLIAVKLYKVASDMKTVQRSFFIFFLCPWMQFRHARCAWFVHRTVHLPCKWVSQSFHMQNPQPLFLLNYIAQSVLKFALLLCILLNVMWPMALVSRQERIHMASVLNRYRLPSFPDVYKEGSSCISSPYLTRLHALEDDVDVFRLCSTVSVSASKRCHAMLCTGWSVRAVWVHLLGSCYLLAASHKGRSHSRNNIHAFYSMAW